MLSRPLRAAVVCGVLAIGAVGAQIGVAQAQAAEPSRETVAMTSTTTSTTLPCSAVDQLHAALQDLSQTADPAAVATQLGIVVMTLRNASGDVPVALQPVYVWLTAKLRTLQATVSANPTPVLVDSITRLAAQLADAISGVPCTS